MRKILIRYIDLLILIILLIIKNTPAFHRGISYFSIRAIIIFLIIIIIIRILRWIYIKIFFKVRNRILGIILCAGFIPAFFLILLFIIVGYMFMFQIISLDIDHFMQKEISELYALSLKINSLYLQDENIDKNALSNYIEGSSERFPDINFMVFEEETEIYSHKDISIPSFEHQELVYKSFIVYNQVSYIIVSVNKDNIVFQRDFIIAVPLKNEYLKFLSESLEGDLIFVYLSAHDAFEDQSIPQSLNAEKERPSNAISITMPEGVYISLYDSQKADYNEWRDSLPSGLRYFKSFLFQQAIEVYEDSQINNAMVIGIFHADYISFLEKYLKGTIGVIEPFLIFILLIIVLFLIMTGILLLISLFFSFSITRIINQLHKRSKEIAKGNFPEPISCKRKDQLGELTRTFDKMTDEIQDLLEKMKEKERLDNEIAIAQMVQNTFFPKDSPDVKGIDIFGKCCPAKMVSGDFYDFSVYDEDYIDLCIGDISGKGISASLLMATSLTYLRLESGKGHVKSIDKLINDFNDYLCRYSARSQFCSLIYGRINKKDLKFELINAGHPSPVIIRGDEVFELNSSNIVTGIIKDQIFEKINFQLQKGDLIFLYTDGFIEIMTDEGYEMVSDLLIGKLKEMQNDKLDDIYYRLVKEINDINLEKYISDDMTAILARIGNDT